MTNGVDDKTIDKIRAILRKADESKNPSEAERDTAMRMANRLLLKHGLSMTDLGDLDDQPDGRTFEHDRYFDVESEADAWRGALLNRIGIVYFSKVYRVPMGRDRYRYMVVGRSDHVQTTKLMFEFIEPQVLAEFNIALAALTKTTSKHQQQQARLARKYAISAAIEYLREMEEGVAYTDLEDDELAEIGRQRFEGMVENNSTDYALLDVMNLCDLSSMHYAKKAAAFIKRGDIAAAGVENLAVWRRSFYSSAVGRIGKRLQELMREEIVDLGEPGVALVKSEQANLDAFLESLNLGLHTGRSNRTIDPHGAAAGRAAGDRADLNPNRKVRPAGLRELGSGKES